jgi:hypothetical protein
MTRDRDVRDVTEETIDRLSRERARRRSGLEPVSGIVDKVLPTTEVKEAAPARSWPSPLGEKAMHGLAGQFIRLVEPHTEADRAALLLQFLVGFGNLIGRGAYLVAEADRHFANEYVALVGPTGKGRKGSSYGQAMRPLGRADEVWRETRVTSGLSSGEGLIWAVRDSTDHDPGVPDKRLLVYVPELASIFQVMARQGGTLSAVVREAWDDGRLRITTKNSPAVATDAHISIIGHITRDELVRYFDRTELGNGFANRFLWVASTRARLLPFGGRIESVDFTGFQNLLAIAIKSARERGVRELTWSSEAAELWKERYQSLSEGRGGLLGAATGRAEAHVLRLALLYAVLDDADAIGLCHLEAALEVWRYADDSARYIFGDAIGNPDSDKLLKALRASGATGMTLTDQSNLFDRHLPADKMAQLRDDLRERGLARPQIELTGGRPLERWVAIGLNSPISLNSHPRPGGEL